MDLLTILVFAVGLSMDAFAVSVTSGAVYKKFEIKHTLVMAVSFGAFQAFIHTGFRPLGCVCAAGGNRL